MNIAQNVELNSQRTPDHAALIFEGQTFSYLALNQLVNRVANGLQSLGLTQGDRVALFLPNTPEFVISYLAVQKIGAIAVSLNFSLQSNEVSYILADSGSKAVITTAELRAQILPEELPELKEIIVVDENLRKHLTPTLSYIGEGVKSPLDVGGIKGGSEIAWQTMLAQASPVAQAREMKQDDAAAIVYTSGTTGFPKGATLSHGNVISNMQAKQYYMGVTPQDRMLLFLPLFHCFGQNAVLNSGLYAGATIILHRKFNLEQVFQAIIADQVSMFFAVPTIFILLYDKAPLEVMQRLRYVFSAAAILPVEIAQKWHEKFGQIIYQGYGLTETSPFASYNHLEHYKFGSIGTPITDVKIRIIDVDNGHELPPGSRGEIVISGPNVMLGYWNRPADTAIAITDGWFHTGDIGKMDEEGYFFIEDRLKDMIVVGALKVYPAEVENVLYQHPAVAEAAVYGLPNTVMGEEVWADVVLKANQSATIDEIITFCHTRLAAYKIPAKIQFVTELPKSPTGKILKRVLRDRYKMLPPSPESGGGQGGGNDFLSQLRQLPPAQARQNLLTKIKTDVCQVLEVADIAPDQKLFEFGLTSLMALQLKEKLQLLSAEPLSATLVFHYPSIQRLTDYLISLSASQPVSNQQSASQLVSNQSNADKLNADTLTNSFADKLNADTLNADELEAALLAKMQAVGKRRSRS